MKVRLASLVERDDLPVKHHRPAGEVDRCRRELRERGEQATTIAAPNIDPVRGEADDSAPPVPFRFDREPRRIDRLTAPGLCQHRRDPRRTLARFRSRHTPIVAARQRPHVTRAPSVRHPRASFP
jgi:hypothetical protein